MIIHLQKISLAAIVAVGTLLSLPAQAGQPLTEGESLRRGLARPEVADLARSRVSEAEADALEAGLWANPTLEYARDKARSSTGTQEEAWRLAQPFDLSGRRGLKREAGEQRVVAAEAEARHSRSERAGEIRRGFYQLLLRTSQLAAIDTWASRFTETERVVGKLRAAGEASGYDLRRLARERQAAQARQAETRAELERSREQFAALIGANGNLWNGVSGRLLPLAPAALPALLATLDSRPELAVLAARASAADLDGRAAGRGWLPEVTLGIGSKRTDDGFSRDSATLFSVSVPLPVFDRQQAGERRAAAQAMGARAEYGLARSRAEGQLRGIHGQAVQLITAAERYRREAVSPSADLLRIAETAYRAGESTVLELLDAYKGALEAENTALDLEWKAREACIELDQLTGSHAE
jgi:cobalt-zinc-cadmium efflux system outer membrane protein